MPLSRFVFICLLCFLAACDAGPEKRVNEEAGPISASARNRFASEDPGVLLRAARGFENSGQFGAAYKLYQQVEAVDPMSIPARLGSARTLVQGGQVETGLALFRRLSIEHPKDRQVRTAFVNALLRSNRVAEARSVLDNGNDLSLTEKLQLGVLDEIMGDTERARRLWDEVGQAAPRDGRAGQYLAISFALDGFFETAVQLLQEGLNSAETERESKRTLAIIYSLSDQLDAARAILSSAYPYDETERQLALYRLLPQMNRQEQAMAALLGRVDPQTMARLRPDTGVER